eukprot:5994347-Ditylum_brightwellii.AAC.1
MAWAIPAAVLGFEALCTTAHDITLVGYVTTVLEGIYLEVYPHQWAWRKLPFLLIFSHLLLLMLYME